MPAPQVRLELIDATELAEALTFISQWLAGPDHAQLAASFGRSSATTKARLCTASARTDRAGA